MKMIGNYKTYVEIPTFFLMISVYLHGPVQTSLLIYRTCYINLGYNESECALLGSENKDNYTQKLERLVEPHANVIATVLSLLPGISCAILALFIGSWSDRFGRKPMMVATMIGQLIYCGIMVIFCFLPNISSWYIILATIPIILSGGLSAIMTIFLSYLTDVTDENSRGVRMGILEIVLSIGMLLGMISSSYIFNSISYIGVFLVTGLFYLLALLYIIFVMEESLLNIETEGKLKAFFELKQIKVLAITAFKRRPNHKRTLILLCLAIISIFMLAVQSEGRLLYLFLRLKFGWILRQYTLLTSVRDIVSLLGTFTCIYGLHKLLKVDETIVILMGLISSMGGSLILGLANSNAVIYFAVLIRCLAGNVSPMLRSLISKIAEPGEVGKIFSVLIMSETLLSMLGSPLFTYIYNKTLDTHPEFFNFVSAGLLGVTIILTIIVGVLHLRISKSTVLIDDPSAADNEDKVTT